MAPYLEDPRALDAEWYRCRREARGLMTVELALTVLAVGLLVVVALCGIVTISRAAVATGDVALPLGLGLAVSLALVLLGLGARARISHERSRRDLFRVECARRSYERLAACRNAGHSLHPYRTQPSSSHPTCALCVFVEDVRLG